MIINEKFKNIPIYQPGKSEEEVKKEYGLKQVVKLASNENPFGQSKRIKERILKEVNKLAIYPDGAGRKLRNKLATFYGINEAQIILGNGSDELIKFLSRVYLNPSREVIMASPTFPIYKANAMMEDAKVVEVPLKDGKHDLKSMASVVTDKTAMIWVCNPNNPTGTMVSEIELIELLDNVPQNALVIVDEAYAEYVIDDSYPDVFKLMKKYSNLMVLRTFSKAYGIAGLRIGYGIADRKIINDLIKIKEPFNTNSIAQASAEEAISDQDFVKYSRELNNKSKIFFINGLKDLNIDFYPSQTNFVFVKHNMDDKIVFQKLIEKGIIIRPGDKLGLPGAMRVTLGTIEDMTNVLAVLKELK